MDYMVTFNIAGKMKTKISLIIIWLISPFLYGETEYSPSFWGWSQREYKNWYQQLVYGYYQYWDDQLPDDTSPSWINHVYHGWLYVANPMDDWVWFYSPILGWITTTPEPSPQYYSLDKGWGYYLNRSHNPQWYYWREKKQWEAVYTGIENPDYFTYNVAPELIYEVEPDYTGKSGDRYVITATFLLTEKGSVKDPELSENILVPQEYKQAVIAALGEFEYVPAKLNGVSKTIVYWHQFVNEY